MSDFLQVKPSRKGSSKPVLSIATSPSSDEQITHVFVMQKDRKNFCKKNEDIGSFKISIKSPKRQINSQKDVLHSKNCKTPDFTSKQGTQNFTGHFDSELTLKRIRSQTNINLNCMCQDPVRSNIDSGNSQFYKYWKEKANDYQSQNFSLLSKNSNLKLQIEQLKLENKNLQKKLAVENEMQKKLTETNEQNMRKIETLENLNKQLDSQVFLLTQQLNKSLLELQINRIKMETLRQHLNSNIKRAPAKLDDYQDIKTRWSLKESKTKNKSKNPLWEDQLHIPQVLSNKHWLESSNQNNQTELYLKTEVQQNTENTDYEV